MSDSNPINDLGPLEPLLADKTITEIIVDAPDHVLVERNGKLEETGVKFASEAAVREVITQIGVQLAAGQTIVDLRLRDGSRVLAVFPPTAVNGPCLVIRKWLIMSRTWEKFIEGGAITPEALALLREAILARQNLLIVGGTESGKTILAGLITQLIPEEDHVVVVEEIQELYVQRARTILLEAGCGNPVLMNDLLTTASKLYANWLVVGELMGPIAMRVIELFGFGHTGLTTFHAHSVEDALSRLEVLCLKANLGFGVGQIRSMIASAFSLITFQERLPNGSRKITQIVELRGVENDRYVLCPLFRYSPEIDKLEPTGEKPRWRR